MCSSMVPNWANCIQFYSIDDLFPEIFVHSGKNLVTWAHMESLWNQSMVDLTETIWTMWFWWRNCPGKSVSSIDWSEKLNVNLIFQSIGQYCSVVRSTFESLHQSDTSKWNWRAKIKIFTSSMSIVRRLARNVILFLLIFVPYFAVVQRRAYRSACNVRSR